MLLTDICASGHTLVQQLRETQQRAITPSPPLPLHQMHCHASPPHLQDRLCHCQRLLRCEPVLPGAVAAWITTCSNFAPLLSQPPIMPAHLTCRTGCATASDCSGVRPVLPGAAAASITTCNSSSTRCSDSSSDCASCCSSTGNSWGSKGPICWVGTAGARAAKALYPNSRRGGVAAGDTTASTRTATGQQCQSSGASNCGEGFAPGGARTIACGRHLQALFTYCRELPARHAVSCM